MVYLWQLMSETSTIFTLRPISKNLRISMSSIASSEVLFEHSPYFIKASYGKRIYTHLFFAFIKFNFLFVGIAALDMYSRFLFLSTITFGMFGLKKSSFFLYHT